MICKFEKWNEMKWIQGGVSLNYRGLWDGMGWDPKKCLNYTKTWDREAMWDPHPRNLWDPTFRLNWSHKTKKLVFSSWVRGIPRFVSIDPTIPKRLYLTPDFLESGFVFLTMHTWNSFALLSAREHHSRDRTKDTSGQNCLIWQIAFNRWEFPQIPLYSHWLYDL